MWPHLGHKTRSVSSLFGGIWAGKGRRISRTNEICRKFDTLGTAVFFVDLRKDIAGSRWLLSKIAGGPHAATSIWNKINRLGLVAPWCDPGPRHQILLFLRPASCRFSFYSFAYLVDRTDLAEVATEPSSSDRAEGKRSKAIGST